MTDGRGGSHPRKIPWITGATIDTSMNGHPSARARFWSHVTIAGNEECWDWSGVTVRGYGQLIVLKERWYAHRFSFFLANGEFDRTLEVMHRCDRPPCVNPRHLKLGTHAQNMSDASIKGRMRGAPPRKLTTEQIGEIRSSVESTSRLADRFDVTTGYVRAIRRRVTA